MELRQIRYFVAVAEEGNFGAASRRLNVSQPPITRQIRQLELELGVTLFKRTPKGAELTAAGEAFLHEARQSLSQLAHGVERSRAAQRGALGTLHVGYFGSPIYRLVPELLRAFHATLPEVNIALHRLSKGEQIAALKAGRIHIGFGRYFSSEPGIVVEEILREGLALALPEGLKTTEKMGLRLLRSVPLVLFPDRDRPNFADEVLSVLKREGVEPKVVDVTEDIRSALTLVAIGERAAIVPGSVADLNWSGLRFAPLQALEADCPVHCVYAKGKASPLLRSVLDIVRTFKRG